VLAETILATVMGGLAFVAMSLVLRIPELPTIVGVMGDLIRRPRRT